MTKLTAANRIAQFNLTNRKYRFIYVGNTLKHLPNNRRKFYKYLLCLPFCIFNKSAMSLYRTPELEMCCRKGIFTAEKTTTAKHIFFKHTVDLCKRDTLSCCGLQLC